MGYLYDLFYTAAAQHGQAVALDGSQGHMTYAELMERADDLHRALVRAGVRPGSRVGVADTLGIDLYPAVLAISSAGCSVVSFMDGAGNEVGRLRRLCLSATMSGSTAEVIPWDAGAHVTPPAEPECYVLSTSGSTSAPKDVAISERNLASYAAHLQACGRMRPSDRISQNFKPHFDAFYEVLLMAGLGRGTIVTSDGRQNLLVERFCRQWGITVWNSVPSQVSMAYRLRQLSPESLPEVKWAVFGGEVLSSRSLSFWQQAAPACAVVNSYGPAEATIAIAEFVVQPGETIAESDVPIGTILPHMEQRLVESQGHPGELELCVRGPQLFDGYLDSAHDAGRFYPADSLDPEAGRWYRTGDIVTEGPSGLVFQRRVNQEVKVRGKRVDLVAVEAELCRDSAVADARAVVVDDAVHAIVEAATPEPQDKPIDVSGLRDYARPRTIVWVSSLPRLANGKSDLRALERLVRQGRRYATGEDQRHGE